MSSMLPLEFETGGPLPELVHGYVSVVSQGGQSAFSAATETPPARTDPFHATTNDRDEARRVLEKIGFTILAESPLGLAIAGPVGAYEELSGGTVVRRERLMHAESGHQRYVTHLDITGTDQPSVLGLGTAKSTYAKIE